MNIPRVARLVACSLIACLGVRARAAEDAYWPQFRGPDGQGHAQETGLPETWSESENVLWRQPIAGLGWSSPVVAEGKIWLTTAVPADADQSLRLLCLDLASGATLQDIELFHAVAPAPIHSKNSYASPTPIIEGDRLYVHFGLLGTACVGTDGTVHWKTATPEFQYGHGPGGSPELYGDLLIVNCDGTDRQFVAALDKHSGELVWQTDRDGRMAYSTPLVIHAAEQDQLISTGGDFVGAYEPQTGAEIWRVRYDGYSLVPRPVFGEGVLVICSGYDSPSVYAIRPDGRGDTTDSHVLWSLRRGAPLNPSPLLLDKDLYLLSDNGILSCVDVERGPDPDTEEPIWSERLGGNFSASPLFADGRIYLLDENGLCHVIRPGRTFQPLAQNQLPGRTLASLAVAGKSLLLRTDTHLYRLGVRP